MQKQPPHHTAKKQCPEKNIPLTPPEKYQIPQAETPDHANHTPDTITTTPKPSPALKLNASHAPESDASLAPAPSHAPVLNPVSGVAPSASAPGSVLEKFFLSYTISGLGPAQAHKLAQFVELLAKWNTRTNLVGPREPLAIAQNLIVDSLYLAEFLRKLSLPPAPEIWDLGSGAGIPGIPLHIINDAGNYHLVEVREKRVLFLRTALALLKLTRTQVFSGQAQTFMPMRAKAQKPASLIISRAFMPWQKLLPLSAPYLAPGGYLMVLSNDPPPINFIFPGNWKLAQTLAYRVLEKERYFWALQLPSA